MIQTGAGMFQLSMHGPVDSRGHKGAPAYPEGGAICTKEVPATG